MVKDNTLAQFPLLIERETVSAKLINISIGLLVTGIWEVISPSVTKEF
ncbi:hypothetical protein LPICM17_660057 [Lactococcus piscium]|nr:hypothetical protein LPICM17_660057 [Lactococcus piscium]